VNLEKLRSYKVQYCGDIYVGGRFWVV